MAAPALAAKAAALALGGAVALTLTQGSGGSGGTAGAGIQGAPIVPGHPVAAGQSVALPPVFVVNVGSGPEMFTFRLEVAERCGHHSCHTARGWLPVPPAWVRGLGQRIPIAAGADAAVKFSLVIPAGAEPGRYVCDLDAIGSPGTIPGRANFGAGAGTLLRFTVVDPAARKAAR